MFKKEVREFASGQKEWEIKITLKNTHRIFGYNRNIYQFLQ